MSQDVVTLQPTDAPNTLEPQEASSKYPLQYGVHVQMHGGCCSHCVSDHMDGYCLPYFPAYDPDAHDSPLVCCRRKVFRKCPSAWCAVPYLLIGSLLICPFTLPCYFLRARGHVGQYTEDMQVMRCSNCACLSTTCRCTITNGTPELAPHDEVTLDGESASHARLISPCDIPDTEER
jgi:hypothetical protein